MSPQPQVDFASALRDPSRKSAHPPARFAIYRGNRIAALTESLAATYSATERIVGAPFFDTLARAFIAAHPPCSPVLHEYGVEMPDFIAGFASAESLPYLADVARIEWAWMAAYHAADCEPLAAEILAGHDDAALLGARFTLHPTAALIRSPHPAGTIWQMNAEGGTPGVIADWHGETVLVLRPHLDVMVRIIPDETAVFLAALDAGLPLTLAAETGLHADPAFDLACQLSGAFALGLIVATSLPEPTETSS